MNWLLKPERQERAGFLINEKPHDQRLLPAGCTDKQHPHDGDRYTLTVRDERTLSFAKSRDTRPAGPKVKVVTVTYDGHLTVTDPHALRRTLTQGIGRAKAYGCGLMTLAPVPAG